MRINKNGKIENTVEELKYFLAVQELTDKLEKQIIYELVSLDPAPKDIGRCANYIMNKISYDVVSHMKAVQRIREEEQNQSISLYSKKS